MPKLIDNDKTQLTLMAKRFTATDKWNKKFIRSLKPAYKLLWLYITDECDVAGIWEVDLDVAIIKIGMKVTEKEALKVFGDKITLIDNGNKWFINSFPEFQYGEIQPQNRAHTKIIFLLKKYNLLTDDFKIKPLTSPLQGGEDKVMEEEEEMEWEMVGEEGGPKNENSNTIILPFTSETFGISWINWKEFKKEQHNFTYKGVKPEQAALHHLVKLSGNDEQTAIAIIEQSIGNSWKGLFPIKQSNNGQSNSNNKTPITADATKSAYDFFNQRNNAPKQ